jgi:hypothetical protein
MKLLISISYLLLFSHFLLSQQDLIDLFREEENDKIEKWLNKNPEGQIQTLQSEISLLEENGFFAGSSCFAEQMHVLELAILYQNKALIEKFLKQDLIANNTELLSYAISKAVIVNDLELVKRLWKLGGKLNEYCPFCHDRNNLQLAFGNNTSKEMVDFFLEHSTEQDFSHIDCTNSTTLHMLSTYKDISYLKNFFPKVKHLLMKRNIDGDIPFHLALFNSKKEHALFLWNQMDEKQKRESLVDYASNAKGLSLPYQIRMVHANIEFVDSLFASIGDPISHRFYAFNTLVKLGKFYSDIYAGYDFPNRVQDLFDMYNKALGLKIALEKDLFKYKTYMDLESYIFYRDLALNPYLIKQTKLKGNTEVESLEREIKDYFENPPLVQCHLDTMIIEPMFFSEMNQSGEMGTEVLNDYKFHFPYLMTVEFLQPDEEELQELNNYFYADVPNLILHLEKSPYEEVLNCEFLPKLIYFETLRISGCKKVILPNEKEMNLREIYVPKGTIVENLLEGTKLIEY